MKVVSLAFMKSFSGAMSSPNTMTPARIGRENQIANDDGRVVRRRGRVGRRQLQGNRGDG